VQALLDDKSLRVSPADFGIIAPYRKQVAAIRAVLRNRELGSVRVGCVNDYQGQEAKIIIVSTVLSGLHLQQGDASEESPHSFLNNPKRFNVVLSRAAALLVVVGNPMVLMDAPCWKDLVRFCVMNDSYKGCKIRDRGKIGGATGTEGDTTGVVDEAAVLADLVAAQQFLGTCFLSRSVR
jgi:superfamily I DNA and/or RNA helicase